MYSYLKGTVTEIDSTSITLDVNNVGYLIYTANPYEFILDKEYKVYLYKGLGCKMALPMLATGSVDGIMDAIERENILYLKKFPKIGDKVARQIILDLKGKLASKTEVVNKNLDELTEVLKGLGYKTPDIKKILPSIDDTKDINNQVKDALKLLLK